MKSKHSRFPIRVLVPALAGATVLILWLTVNNGSVPTKPIESRGREVTNAPKPEALKAKPSNWVTISYGGLVDGSARTHSGETVAEVIQKLPGYDKRLHGLVQQYLEPFSLLCHDVVLFRGKADTIPFVNITSHYPVGSAQPAWADLFREGQFQLYYNPYLIRLFLKGSDAKESFNKCQSVVRHAIQDVLDCDSASIRKLEVYVFSNDYAGLEIRLNTVPTVYAIDKVDLSAKHKNVDLASLKSFFDEGVTLEAVEVDDNNDLYFYGRKANDQTIAGSPLSLSDFAVAYRSVFHYGNNPPYISLDKHEDNRYAKVNFGGHLENTRVGQVVLEADKLFKTLSTGIDPNTHDLLHSRIARYVPGFLTEDERSLIDGQMNRALIRYWFYPDSIGTVTDGTIGAVLAHQFLADVERMNVRVNVSGAAQETISHFNRHFADYENAENTYKELSAVGRIMALVNWLRGMNMNERVELDDFLAVPLPACITPSRTKKMLAVSTIAYPKNLPPNANNVRTYSRVFYLSHILDRYDASTSDKRLLDAAAASINDDSYVAIPRVNELRLTINLYEPLIKRNKSTIAAYKRRLDQRRYRLKRSNQKTVDSYDSLLATQKGYINIYNEALRELKDLAIQTHQVVSIGGGIDLSPEEFKAISRDMSSPRIRELANIRNTMGTAGKVARSAEWVRSTVASASPRTVPMPKTKWTVSKLTQVATRYNYRLGSGDLASVSISPNHKQWESRLRINGQQDMIKVSKSTNLLQISHPEIKGDIVGKISLDGRRVDFSR